MHDALGLIAAKHVYDVILCDLTFVGGPSGRYFYERALAMAPEQVDRLLFVSGSHPAERDPLASRFVSKAASFAELRRRIHEVMPPTCSFTMRCEAPYEVLEESA